MNQTSTFSKQLPTAQTNFTQLDIDKTKEIFHIYATEAELQRSHTAALDRTGTGLVGHRPVRFVIITGTFLGEFT